MDKKAAPAEPGIGASMGKPDTSAHRKRILLWLRLGASIRNLHLKKFGQDDPYESRKPADPPEVIAERIAHQTLTLQSALTTDSSMAEFRKLFAAPPRKPPQRELVQTLACILYNDLSMANDESSDSIIYAAGSLFGPDIFEGRLLARAYLAELIDKKLVVLNGRVIRAAPCVHKWVTGDNILMFPGLHEDMVRAHFTRKAAAQPKAEEQPRQLASEVFTPSVLFNQLKEIVIGQDHACRVLATRGWLHLKRAELLKQGEKVGTNECVFFISQHSGVGKTFLAENYGRLCSLPFASFSATDATSVGYVGLDLVEDSIRSLIRSAGGAGEAIALEKARLGGIIFYDEWTKKRASSSDSGRDINAVGVQNEILRLMEGCKVILGNRRVDRDTAPVEFDSSGLMFVFGGFVADFDKIIEKQHGCTIGFGDNQRRGHGDAYISDALISIGFIPEFVNRLSKVVVFKKLTTDDLIAIATSRRGVLNAYRYLLKSSGLTFRVEDAGLRHMAEVSAETGMMARGMRLIIGSLIEELVFSGTKGEVVLSLKEVEEAVGRVMAVNAVNAVDAVNAVNTVEGNNLQVTAQNAGGN